MNRIVIIIELDSSSFEVRVGLCLPSAIPSVEVAVQMGKWWGHDWVSSYSPTSAAPGTGKTGLLGNLWHHGKPSFFPGHQPCAVHSFKCNI